MKQFLAGLLVFGALGSVACGSDDDGNETVTPEAACQSEVATICSKIWGGCVDSPSSTPVLWGLNEADCRTKYEQNRCSAAMVECGAGETYNQAKAQECLDQYKAMSCDQLKKLVPPSACGATCQ
ncbi:MAG TPA: hypothetical protein VHB79_13910 [Polyangiaceae bacterium]|nr:hypothetical protein [Polyangiaceae bacterium]